MAPPIRPEDRLTSGHRLSHPAPGDKVVITGISGSFPESDSVKQLQENLFKKMDLVTEDDRRWEQTDPDIPQRTGKINNLNKFDASFFDVHYKRAHTMDPGSRIILEKAYEAIFDAGLNPKELRNTRTGVFIGAGAAESEKMWLYNKMHVNAYGFLGCSQAMIANNISNWLGVTGPSLAVSTGCSSSLYALDHAFRAIRDGHCDAAIVGASNLCLHPYISLQYFGLGVLSPDGRCKTFDNSANGYVRSEGLVVCFLQKFKDSRRIHAQLVYAKTNNDGYKEQGIAHPSGDLQKILFKEFYEECSISPSSVEFIEAHGTGTEIGDKEEVNAIDEVFCTERSKPLLIGSVKTNLGHTETAAGLCAIAKMCIAFSTGYIPPNLHYNIPRQEIRALKEGKIKVVTVKQPWCRGMVGINSFGFGGCNCHTLFKNIAKSKVNNGLPSDDLPRLVCASGRTESAVARILDDLESRPVDVEFVRLLHAIHDEDITGHLFRGHTLLSSTSTNSISLSRDIKYFCNVRRPVCFVYSGIGSEWAGIAAQLTRVPIFAASIMKCHKILECKGIDLVKIITEPDTQSDNILNNFIGIAALHIGLTDVLKAIGIQPDLIIGHSTGELGCAYADGCLTADQMILSAYYQGLALTEVPFIQGSMAVVHLGYKKIKAILPPAIDVAYHNGPDSCTISGPEDKVKTYVADLVAQGIFAEEISHSNIAYHSRYISGVGPKVLSNLKLVIPKLKMRSNCWLSTSIEQNSLKDPEIEMSAAEYFTYNLLNPVLFEETMRMIPANAITIEITKHDLLQGAIESQKKDVINISLTERGDLDSVQVLFTALGKLYEAGLNPRLANLYPTIQFPVSQGTPLLAHLVEWEHNENWQVASFREQTKITSNGRIVRVSTANKYDEFILGHVVDGRNLYPATGYIVMAWETFAMMMGERFTELSVTFENIQFHRATIVPESGHLEFTVVIQRGSGHFEIIESGSSVVTGRIYTKKNVGQGYTIPPHEIESTEYNAKKLLAKDFYKELRLRGYEYRGLFRGVIDCNVEGTFGRLAWNNNWVTFLDSVMQMRILSKETRALFVPTRIEKLHINTDIHNAVIIEMSKFIQRHLLNIRFYPNNDVMRCCGVEIRGLHTAPISRISFDLPLLEKYVFVPQFGMSHMKIEEVLRSNIQLIVENMQTYKVKCIEIIDDEYRSNRFESIMEKLSDVLKHIPLVESDLSVTYDTMVVEPPYATVKTKKRFDDNKAHIIVGANLLQRPEVLQQTLQNLRDQGFIMSREKKIINSKGLSNEFNIISIQSTDHEYIVLLRKRVAFTSAKFVKVTAEDDFAWIDKVKDELKTGQKMVIYSEDELMNGLLGLINCLRKEPGGEVVRALIIMDPSAPPFNPGLKFYEDQLNMDLVINVYQDGQWGTYRHLLLDNPKKYEAHHAFLKSQTIGDLSSLRWLEGPLSETKDMKNPEDILIHVYCSALNFRDVAIAMGRVIVDSEANDRLTQCVQGFEVVGRTKNGLRVMAILKNCGISNMVVANRRLTWSIPDEWTFEEAASIPVAYATVYYALVMVGRIKRGESILIHAGSGGVGQAAINVALHYGAEVFTTVGTPEKRGFIKKLFPQLKDSHIGNSRDTSFENMIKEETKGKGVDLVLNSLSDDKLQASVRCLGHRGRFLEIGRYDITNNTLINMNHYSKEISFHGIVLDSLMDKHLEFKKQLQALILSGIESGTVRPLTNCTFEKDQVETAFRYMAAGKHIGKMEPIRSENRLTSGHRLSHPAPGDEVVITGISGSFPDSDSVLNLQENLFNKVDLISEDTRRWETSQTEIPQRTGKIGNLDKFDASFFGFHFKQAHTMDPMGRIILEKAYEAIIDAGVNPKELRNTRTGVFIAACLSESEKLWFYEKMQVNQHGIIGCSRSMLANRISNWLGVTGPSYAVDTACSSSLYALDHAYKAIRDGQCDAAIVGASNLCLHPNVSLQFFRIGILSPDGKCKCFDEGANGYVRSEGVVVCFLQKAKDSRRIYAQVIHAKTNCDGYKEKGITYPSGEIQKLLFTEFYEECSIPTTSIEFVEAHGTGTKVGDPEELKAIEDVFCNGRSGPLFIGSIKSNLGHTEAASGLSSIVKLCIAYKTGFIPPNLHYNVPRKVIPSLTNGKFKVVTDKQPWNKGLAAINSFGFGGANAHVVLKNMAKSKINNGLPSDDLPRLVCVSGRTESAVARILDDLESRTVDVELVRLLHAIHDDDIVGHNFRGYTLLGSTTTKSVSLVRNVQYASSDRRPVCFVYSDIGSQWAGMATQLMRIPVFAAAIEKCHKTLEPKGIDLTKIITDPDPKIDDNILNSFVGIAAVQIGLTDVLKTVGIEPDFIAGHGVGELGCAYADNCLTAEQMILSAYYLALVLKNTTLDNGSMAVVNLGYNEIKKLTSEIDVAYRDGPDLSTISGPEDTAKTFTTKLTKQEISAKETHCIDMASQSRYVTNFGEKLLNYLKQVIPAPKPRSHRWLCSSMQQDFWDDPVAKMSSSEYHTNNFLSPVLFEDIVRMIPENAITIEIAPHGLLQKILCQSVQTNIMNICLTDKGHKDNVQVLFTALGKLYEAGLNPHLANIYPTVQFPVSQETPMLAHLIEWEHSKSWFVPSFKNRKQWESGERTVNVSITEDSLLDGHNQYSAANYIVMVWETLAMMLGELHTAMSVVFENIVFHKSVYIPKDGKLEFVVTIHKHNGLFEIVETGSLVVTGRVYAKKNIGQEYRALPDEPETIGPNVKHMLTRDFYKELRLRGYRFSVDSRGVIGCNVNGTRGRLAWIDNWQSFLACMFQMKIIGEDTRALLAPTGIEKLSIDSDMHYAAVSKKKVHFTKHSFEVKVYPNVNVIRAGGVEIRGLQMSAIFKKNSFPAPLFENYTFVPNFGKSEMKIDHILRNTIQLIFENMQSNKFSSVEIVDDEYKKNGFEPVMDIVRDVLNDLPLAQADLYIHSDDLLENKSNVTIENKKLNIETNAVLVIGANLIQRPRVLNKMFLGLRHRGFIISREKKIVDLKDFSSKYDVISIQNTDFEHMVLFRKRAVTKPTKYLKIVTADDTYAWIDKVKDELKKRAQLVLYSQNEDVNGLLGLVNCLKKEPDGEVVRGLLITDPSAPAFNPDLDFYKEQLDKDLVINVYQEGQWGTYRHLLLGDLETVQAHHAFISIVTSGDLSTIRWLEGPIKKNHIMTDPNAALIHVYCASINFRDVLVATGRRSLDAKGIGRLENDCVLGLEVVGRSKNGKRVMAMVQNSGIANMVMGDRTLMWSIPDEWTFEEAATVPVAYGTAYYALVIVGKIKKGESILIHAGSGGVGQAAINVALHYGAEVFTTVGTPEKQAFIKKLFPQIKDSHIGNSRDTSFEQMIRRETNGKGVDLVLNSLSDDKLQASIRCLGFRGRFLEIGKFNISNNTPVDLSYFSNETSFHGITLDRIYSHSDEFKKTFRDLLLSGIEIGAVRPLTNCTFEKDQVETAFRYMAAGKHIGKVIIKIRDEENIQTIKPSSMPLDARPRHSCHPDLVYIVVGGLGGFGLELADWLIIRGARKVLLTSRRGITNGYQSSRLKTWTSYRADVRISTDDITTEEGCEQMLKMANDMGTVEAIFNLAVVLKDCLFLNQTPETFRTSFAAKGLTTINLDKLSRELCPHLRNFVIFSSMSCGRGNAGQTNYGFSNSVMERICDSRRKLGLPALGIQWGAIGDVGVLADTQNEDVQFEIGGTLQQKISSCFTSLDKLLSQDAAVASSVVVAGKKTEHSECENIVDAIARIMGIKDLTMVPHQVSLADLGMDSMMVVEIIHSLDLKYEIFMTAQDIRSMTFGRLAKMASQRRTEASTNLPANSDISDNNIGLPVFMKNIGDEKLGLEPFICPLSSVIISSESKDQEDKRTMFILPDLDGSADALLPLCRELKVEVCVLQFGYQESDDSLETLTYRLLKTIKPRLNPRSPFILLGYGFGCLPVLKLAEILESEDHKGLVFCIDGSPDFIYKTLELDPTITDTELQNKLICHTIEMISPNNDVTKSLIEKLNKLEYFEDRIQYAVKERPNQNIYSDKFFEGFIKSTFNRLQMVMKENKMKIKSPIVLIRATDNPVVNVEENYGLDKFTNKGPVTVHLTEGNHMTLIQNKDCANIINKILENDRQSSAYNIVDVINHVPRKAH